MKVPNIESCRVIKMNGTAQEVKDSPTAKKGSLCLFSTCVPVVVTCGPGELGSERERQVEQSPHLDHNVAEVVHFHHKLSISNS